MSNEKQQPSSEPVNGDQLAVYQFKLKNITQPCPYSCVSTCMAILAQRPIAEIHALFHSRYLNGEGEGKEPTMSIREMLHELQLPFKSFDSADRNSLTTEPGVSILCVPSLNIVGGNHQILVEMRPDGWWQVLDPARGFVLDGKPRMSYTAEESPDPLHVTLHSGYTVEAFIPYHAIQ